MGEFLFGEGAVKPQTTEVLDLQRPEVRFWDAEDARKHRVIVAQVVIILGGDHHPHNVQLLDGLVVDEPSLGVLFHSKEIDERNSQAFNSAGGIFGDVLDGADKRGFVALASAVEGCCGLVGLGGLDLVF